MPCRRNGNWETAPLARPFGGGINFEIKTKSIAPIVATLASAGWKLFREPQVAWYRIRERETGNRQFLVQDADGYLVRFSEDLGTRAIAR